MFFINIDLRIDAQFKLQHTILHKQICFAFMIYNNDSVAADNSTILSAALRYVIALLPRLI